MDRQSVYTLSLGYGRGSEADTPDPDSRQVIQQKLVDFILEFEIDNVFIYRCVTYEGSREHMLITSIEIRSERTYWSSNITATLTSHI
jgi:hypothetical protein